MKACLTAGSPVRIFKDVLLPDKFIYLRSEILQEL